FEYAYEGGDAVLVAGDVGCDGVAERLFVPVREARDAADPLEPRERLGVRLAVCRSEATQQRGRHDRGGVRTRLTSAEGGVGEQCAGLVAAQRAPAMQVGHADGASVGVGVVGDHDVGVDLTGEVEGEVHRARLFGVGERDGRKLRVRCRLLGHCVHRRETGGLDDPACDLVADSVQRCVNAGDLRGAVADQGADRVDVRVTHGVVEDGVTVVARDVIDPADGCDRGGDLGVGGRHDLAAVAEVDLVTVVLRRIVRSGDHDARVAAEVADGEGEYGCGQRLRKQVRTYPGGLHDLGGVTGEHIGVVSRVEPDDDARVGTGVAPDV